MSALNHTMIEEVRPTFESLRKLQVLRDELRVYLSNEKAEYYDAFKSKYDLCQLLLSLKDKGQFAEYLKLIVMRSKEREPRTTSSFSEIRYTNQ